MKKLFTLMFLMGLGFASMQAQAVGDYGSIATGNWTGASTWGIWDGASFVGTATPPDGTQNIFLQTGTVTLNTVATQNFTKTLTLNGGGLTVSGTGVILAFKNGAVITRANTTGVLTTASSGSIVLSPVSGEVVTVNINASGNAGGETNSGTGSVGKVHLNIASGVTYTLNGNRQVDDLNLSGTLTDFSATSRTMVVKGNITGTGSLTGTGTDTKIQLRYTSGTINISGVTMKNFEMYASGNIGLTGDVTITNKLTLTQNKISLGTFNLTLNTGATIVASAPTTSYIATNSSGKLTLPITGGVATLVPIGSSVNSYDPATITPTSTAAFTVGISQTFSPAILDGTKAASRMWNLTATGAGNTTIAFTPLVTTLSGTNTPGTAVYGHYTGGAWNQYAASYSSGTWTVTHPSGLGFSPFGVGVLGAFNAVLPTELTTFTAKPTQKTTLLAWTTATEKDNATFNIEQSTNGTDFQTIGQVKGSGTTAKATNYNFEHKDPSVGVNYYRLKQVDFNGTATYSAVRSVVFGKKGLIVKTTLVHDALDIVVSDETATPLPSGSGSTISIFNISGQQVLHQKVQGAQRIDVSALPIGLYIIRTATGDVGRFVKQ